MAKLNITHAAQAVGKSRRTIQNHIKKGLLSYEIDNDGNKSIDTAELIRVYGKIKNSPTSNSQQSSQRNTVNDSQHFTSDFAPVLQQEIRILGRENETLRQDKEDLKQTLKDERYEHRKREEMLHQEKEKLLTFLERSQLQLEDLRNREPVKEKPVEVPPENNRLLVGGLVTAIVILLIIIAFTAPRIDKFYGLGLFSPDFHAWIETLVGKLF